MAREIEQAGTPKTVGFLDKGGEMGARMRAHAWAATPLGAPALWPQSLKAAVRIMLSSRYAMWMAWGPALTFFCNDAYKPTLGVKETWALGSRSDKVWAEIWPDIGPRIARVLGTGEATWDEALLLFLERSGFAEETYHTFSYSPLADDDGRITGMLCVVTEETERVIGERRLRVLRDLGLRMAETRTAPDIWAAFDACLAAERRDVPFGLAYLRAGADGEAVLAAAVGVEAGTRLAPPRLAPGAAPWPVGEVVEDLAERRVPIDPALRRSLPAGPWDRGPAEALVLPLAGQGQARALGAVVIGLNPYRPLDAAYRGFLDLLVGQLSAGLAAAGAYEAERRRAEALAEIDRAKTAFFSNVSHEFRTPLTLMLGPLEEVLGKPEGGVIADNRRLVEVAHRNGLRLLRLVNALLDFSRIEAGRVQAHYRPTDLASFTADLASSFRAATDKAGLTLAVDCPPLSRPVYVDRDMWEKIVLNLLSNAFKFTFEGTIGVSLGEAGTHVVLRVTDTGTGIPGHELPRLFERFHRVEGARGRSFEGSGIGLALVQELVRLHGGEIAVESEPGRGTAFTIGIPLGADHLPADRVETGADGDSVGTRAQSFVDEALRWLPDGGGAGTLLDVGAGLGMAAERASASTRERIVLADDNADLRGYIARLLVEQGFAVEAVADGAAALEAVRASRPGLLLTDVMMPRLDGFGLLRAVRDDEALRDLPVIMLSARAGEEAKVDGLDAGADDYLTKPFSARELLARVSANLAMARMRRDATAALSESEARFRNMADHAPVMMWVTDVDGACTYLNRAWYGFTGQTRAEAEGFGWLDVTHPDDRPGAERVFRDANAARASFRLEYRLRAADGAFRWMLDAASPRFDAAGAFLGYIGSVIDITERKETEALLAERVEQEMQARREVEETLRQAQKMEAVGQLTGGIAHDFNNLLTIVIGNIDTARRALNNRDGARALRGMDNAQRGAERAASLTQRLLAFSRRQPLAPKATDVDKLVLGMSDLLHRALGETVALETVTSPGLWRVEVDPNQLESALLNLAVNARDAMPEGGRLTIETANARLDETYAASHAEVAPGLYVVVAVTDTGTGMARETLARVFEPFFTTKEIGKGTGLGLSMVYGFTKQSGGHVKLYSEPGQGTTVKIYLPRVMSAGEVEEAAPAREVGTVRRHETILVVEDDEDVRAYTVEILREIGYRVREAHDGATALALLAQDEEPVALLFTDVVMPGMPGSELAERAQALRPALKVLYTSGYTRNAIVHGGRLDPGVEMISKPFTYQSLQEKISDVLDRGATNRILVVDNDAATRRLATAALANAGYTADEAASAAEAFGRVRAAQGRYAAVVLDRHLADKPAEAVAAELRAMHADLPILLAGRDGATGPAGRFEADRRVGTVSTPYEAGTLRAALAKLGVRDS